MTKVICDSILKQHFQKFSNLKMSQLLNEGKSAASLGHQVSISPTFYEQLLRPNPFTKKLQTQIVST